jgi:hypothetical protein
VTTGWGHSTVLSAAGAVLDAVKAGHLKHIFLIGGCDAPEPSRKYYTQVGRCGWRRGWGCTGGGGADWLAAAGAGLLRLAQSLAGRPAPALTCCTPFTPARRWRPTCPATRCC